MDQNSGIGQFCLSIDPHDRDAYFQMLDKFRGEGIPLPDYSPHYGEMFDMINTILTTAKHFQ